MKVLSQSVLLLTLIASLPLQAAETSTFSGRYSASQRESFNEFYVLDDHTFCYLFMGGSLDLMLSGTWQQSDKDQDTIEFTQSQTNNSMHPAQGQYLNRIDNNISIVIDGYSLADIEMAVFAISKDDKLPTTLKPLLPKNNNRGRASYSLPLISSLDAKYIYIGSPEISDENDGNRLQVTQYKIEKNDTIQLSFNNQQNRLSESFHAQLVDGELFINGDPIKNRTELDSKRQQEVKEYCTGSSDEQSSDDNSERWTGLTPNKTFFVNKESVQSDPYFNANDGEQARQVNGIDALIKEEKHLLEMHFKKAESSLEYFDEFLTFSTALLQIEQRKSIYAPLVGMKLSQLLMNTNRIGNLKSAEEQLTAYATKIYPLIKDSTDRQVQYSALVIASQGAVIYGATRKKAVLTTVLDSILGPNFDIETTINPTLVYNLACIYALDKNKPEMLKAIRAARKMKKPMEQFMKDGDFKFYRSDSEFLAAINDIQASKS